MSTTTTTIIYSASAIEREIQFHFLLNQVIRLLPRKQPPDVQYFRSSKHPANQHHKILLPQRLYQMKHLANQHHKILQPFINFITRIILWNFEMKSYKCSLWLPLKLFHTKLLYHISSIFFIREKTSRLALMNLKSQEES